MASAGHTKSAAKTTAARLNARVRRKPATDNPVNPATPDQPVADGTVKLVADTSAPVVKALSVADTKAVADKLKPPATARDYSAVYSSS